MLTTETHFDPAVILPFEKEQLVMIVRRLARLVAILGLFDIVPIHIIYIYIYLPLTDKKV